MARPVFLCFLFMAITHSPSDAYEKMLSDMVMIPAGEFTMGTPDGSDGFPDEHPERRVFLSGYWIDRFEVTNHAYAVFVQATGHRAPANSNAALTL